MDDYDPKVMRRVQHSYEIEAKLAHFIDPYYLAQHLRFVCVMDNERSQALLEWSAEWAGRGRTVVQILMRFDDFSEWVHKDCWYNEEGSNGETT